MSLEYLDLRRDIIDAARKMNALGINRGRSGNISIRVEDGLLITPTGMAYDELMPADIVWLRMDGGYRGKIRPSSEWRIHRDVLAARADAGAVVHAHPPFATALSSLRRSIPPFHYMIAVAGGRDIRCSDYATFGTQALSDKAIAALEGRHACLLANHGAVALGPNLAAALALAVEVEALAGQYMRALAVAEPVLLNEAEIAEAMRAFEGYGQQDLAAADPEDEGSPDAPSDEA